MSTPRTPLIRSAAWSALSLAGGISLAVIPAATLSIAARLFDEAAQGFVSLAIMVATFAGQLTFAAVVESRLSSAATERRVTFPLWLAGASAVVAVVIALNPTNPVILCLGLPVLLASLEVGRGVSVAERLDARETWAAVCVGSGALIGVLSSFWGQSWGFVALVSGILGATIIRSIPVAHQRTSPDRRVRNWVVTDVAITGVIYPGLNALILVFLGPAQAVVFAAVSTVSGLLAIPLNFMRLRLLKAHSSVDVLLAVAVVGVTTAVIVVAEWSGLLGFFFGELWTVRDTLLPLIVACLWRAASIASTLPFAALRRAGQVRVLTGLRAGCAVITLLAGLAALTTGSITVVFATLLGGELLQAVAYEAARRRLGVPGRSDGTMTP